MDDEPVERGFLVVVQSDVYGVRFGWH
jgi:hypothetical protein